MPEYRCSRATVLRFIREESDAIITVAFDKLPSPPIAPATMGDVELHRLKNINELEATFVSYNIGEKLLQGGATYEFHTWWTPWELEIAQSDLLCWRKEEFRPSNAVEIIKDGHLFCRKQEDGEIPQNAKIVPHGWNHEHCGLCCKTISMVQGDEPEGYTDGTDWVCESCYKKYIASGLGKKLG